MATREEDAIWSQLWMFEKCFVSAKGPLLFNGLNSPPLIVSLIKKPSFIPVLKIKPVGISISDH